MKSSLLAIFVFVAACSSASNVIVEPDPLTGAETAYATAFLDGPTTRLVMSASVGTPSPVQLSFWRPAGEAASCDDAALVVGDHPVRGADIEARQVETPSGADQTVTFTVPPAAIRDASERSGRIDVCGESWPLDDAARRVMREFFDAL